MKRYLIGIAGGTGSGKSTFSERLSALFGNRITLVSFDNYYKSQAHLSFEERLLTNYDCPDALDTELLIAHLEALARGESIEMPLYDFKLHTRQEKTELVAPLDIILVDGILAFHDARLRALFDMKIYVDTDADERILRRLRRDVLERGRDIDGVIAQYVSTVKPMHEIYVEPTKKYADIIVNGGKNRNALEIVAARITELLATNE